MTLTTTALRSVKAALEAGLAVATEEHETAEITLEDRPLEVVFYREQVELFRQALAALADQAQLTGGVHG
jgi:hypothetical protein